MSMRAMRWVLGAACAGCLSMTASADGIKADAPFVTVDPRVDGAASFATGAATPDEWGDALRTSDSFLDPATGTTPGGTFYHEEKDSWTATSASGNSATYPGTTYFVAHDIWGAATGLFASFRVNDLGDWNSVEVETPNGSTREVWCFGGFLGNTPPHATVAPFEDVDEPDDGTWITDAGGLMSSALIPEVGGPNLIDDRGFIVRLNGDPSTDRHWFPGMPEPGDPGWDWNAFYGCFARAGFNQTFQSTEIDPVAAHAADHEVYEWCFHDAPAILPTPSPPVPEAPLQCLAWKIKFLDPPKRFIIFVAPDFLIHFAPPPVPAAPWPLLAGLAAALAVGGFLAFRPRRARARSAAPLFALVLAATVAGGCGGGGGGGGGGHKNPPPIVPLMPQPPGGFVGVPYTYQLVATGQHPPFTFVATTGTPPQGTTLAPNGTISGTPTAEETSDFTATVQDQQSNTTTVDVSIHIGPAGSDGTLPIELVSVSLSGVPGNTLTLTANQPALGALRIRYGQVGPATIFFAPAPPPTGGYGVLPAGLQVSGGGVIFGTPTDSGLVKVLLGAQQGAVQSFFDVFFDVQ